MNHPSSASVNASATKKLDRRHSQPIQQYLKFLLSSGSFFIFISCGGGGSSGPPTSVVYQNVYGDICQGQTQATPGCTFTKYQGGYYDGLVQRAMAGDDKSGILVSSSCGTLGLGVCTTYVFSQSVTFNAAGLGTVRDANGSVLFTKDVSQFAGYISGTTIGVGTNGTFWTNVANQSYWINNTGVLYQQAAGPNYSLAINSAGDAENATDTNFSAAASEGGERIVKLAAEKLTSKYKIKPESAQAIAASLHNWGVNTERQGYSTPQDMAQTFNSVFGVEYSQVASAIVDLKRGEPSAMTKLVNRTSSYWGVSEHEVKKLINEFNANAAAQFGYDLDNLNW